jgi:hypothetical protein
MTKKYLYSIVKIPLEISEDGSVKTLEEYANVEFTECHYLPDKTVNNTKTYNNRLREMISSMNFEEEEEERTIKIKGQPEENVAVAESLNGAIPENKNMKILPEEIKTDKSPSKNITFKSKPNSLLRRTSKLRYQSQL